MSASPQFMGVWCTTNQKIERSRRRRATTSRSSLTNLLEAANGSTRAGG